MILRTGEAYTICAGLVEVDPQLMVFLLPFLSSLKLHLDVVQEVQISYSFTPVVEEPISASPTGFYA